MLKNILNLNGAQQLSKNEQKTINGGGPGIGPVECNGYNSFSNLTICEASCGIGGVGTCIKAPSSSCWVCSYDHK